VPDGLYRKADNYMETLFDRIAQELEILLYCTPINERFSAHGFEKACL
jgi:hypothetical protein